MLNFHQKNTLLAYPIYLHIGHLLLFNFYLHSEHKHKCPQGIII
jgi:hypothetical protein